MNNKLKILYAEDNKITAQETSEALEENGYDVRTVHDGNEAWLAFQDYRPDVVLLDYQMPHKNGIEVFSLIRAIDSITPVLILSSFTKLGASSLNAGTDDFIHKEGGIEEVCIRIERAWKQAQSKTKKTYTSSQDTYVLSPSTTFNPTSSLLIVNQKQTLLNSIHAKILHLLCLHQNATVTTSTICKELWNNENQGKTILLRNYISDLRKFLEKDVTLIITASYGTGYCLNYIPVK